MLNFAEYFKINEVNFISVPSFNKNQLEAFTWLLKINSPLWINIENNNITMRMGEQGIYGAFIDPNNNTISFNNNRYDTADPEYDPYNIAILEALAKTNLVNNYKVEIGETTDTLPNILKKIKTIVGKAPSYAKVRRNHRSSDKRFVMRVLKEVWEKPWYHATLKSYIKEIKTKGLLPSQNLQDYINEKGYTDGIPLSDIPIKGYASINFDIQKAVYLYGSYKNAYNLAEGLSHKFRTSTIVLKIDGEALKDYTKLVIDEDALRGFDSTIEYNRDKKRPSFMGSVISSINSIGYKGIILPKYISVKKEIEYIEEDDDY